MDVDKGSTWSRLREKLPDADALRSRVRGFSDRLKARARGVRRRFRSSDTPSVVERLERIDEEYVQRQARRVTEADLDKIVERAGEIEDRFRSGGPLRRFVEDGRLLLALVRDVRQGTYRRIPVWTLGAVGMALLYVLNPFDLIPDAIPVLGLLDDAAVLSACLSLVEQDLHEYRSWRVAHPEVSIANDSIQDNEGALPGSTKGQLED